MDMPALDPQGGARPAVVRRNNGADLNPYRRPWPPNYDSFNPRTGPQFGRIKNPLNKGPKATLRETRVQRHRLPYFRPPLEPPKPPRMIVVPNTVMHGQSCVKVPSGSTVAPGSRFVMNRTSHSSVPIRSPLKHGQMVNRDVSTEGGASHAEQPSSSQTHTFTVRRQVYGSGVDVARSPQMHQEQGVPLWRKIEGNRVHPACRPRILSSYTPSPRMFSAAPLPSREPLAPQPQLPEPSNYRTIKHPGSCTVCDAKLDANTRYFPLPTQGKVLRSWATSLFPHDVVEADLLIERVRLRGKYRPIICELHFKPADIVEVGGEGRGGDYLRKNVVPTKFEGVTAYRERMGPNAVQARRKCIVCGATNLPEEMYPFDQNTQKAKMWCNALCDDQRESQKLFNKIMRSRNPVICGEHFGENCMNEDGELSQDARPNIVVRSQTDMNVLKLLKYASMEIKTRIEEATKKGYIFEEPVAPAPKYRRLKENCYRGRIPASEHPLWQQSLEDNIKREALNDDESTPVVKTEIPMDESEPQTAEGSFSHGGTNECTDAEPSSSLRQVSLSPEDERVVKEGTMAPSTSASPRKAVDGLFEDNDIKNEYSDEEEDLEDLIDMSSLGKRGGRPAKYARDARGRILRDSKGEKKLAVNARNSKAAEQEENLFAESSHSEKEEEKKDDHEQAERPRKRRKGCLSKDSDTLQIVEDAREPFKIELTEEILPKLEMMKRAIRKLPNDLLRKLGIVKNEELVNERWVSVAEGLSDSFGFNILDAVQHIEEEEEWKEEGMDAPAVEISKKTGKPKKKYNVNWKYQPPTRTSSGRQVKMRAFDDVAKLPELPIHGKSQITKKADLKVLRRSLFPDNSSLIASVGDISRLNRLLAGVQVDGEPSQEIRQRGKKRGLHLRFTHAPKRLTSQEREFLEREKEGGLLSDPIEHPSSMEHAYGLPRIPALAPRKKKAKDYGLTLAKQECTVCHRNIDDTPVSLRDHAREHIADTFKCPYDKCKFVSQTRARISYHMANSHEKWALAADMCAEDPRLNKYLNACVRKCFPESSARDVPDDAVQCEICQNMVSPDYGSLYSHSCTHLPSRPFACSACERFTTYTEEEIEMHLENSTCGGEVESKMDTAMTELLNKLFRTGFPTFAHLVGPAPPEDLNQPLLRTGYDFTMGLTIHDMPIPDVPHADVRLRPSRTEGFKDEALTERLIQIREEDQAKAEEDKRKLQEKLAMYRALDHDHSYGSTM